MHINVVPLFNGSLVKWILFIDIISFVIVVLPSLTVLSKITTPNKTLMSYKNWSAEIHGLASQT